MTKLSDRLAIALGADWIPCYFYSMGGNSRHQIIKRQAVEIERLRADAERYRFLRTGRHWPCVFADHDDPEPLCELELDIAIDTAMVPDSVVDKAWQRFEQAVQQPAAEVANPFAKLNKEGK